MRYSHAQASALHGADESAKDGARSPTAPPSRPPAEQTRPETFVRGERKVGRNEPCPCGSGKKYKHCHGQAA
jgi:preprotein translocase subunit SecA